MFLGSGALRAATDPERFITIGKSYVIETPGVMERILVATEDIVEAVATTQREVVLNAKAPGVTSVLIWQLLQLAASASPVRGAP